LGGRGSCLGRARLLPSRLAAWSTTWSEGHDLDTRLRRTIEGLLILTLVVAPVALGSRPPWAMALDGVLISVIAGLWTLRVSAKGGLKLRRTPLDLPIVGLVLLSVLSAFTSIYPYASMVEVARLASYALLYSVIVNNLRGRTSAHNVLTAVVLTGAFLSVYGIYEVASGSEKILWVEKRAFQGSIGAVTGTYWNRNHFGGFLVLILPLGLGMALHEVSDRRWRGAAFYGVLSAAVLAGLVGTFSRASWIGAIAALALMGLLALLGSSLPKANKLGVLAGAAALTLLVAGLAPWKAVDRALSTFEARDPSKAFRYQVLLSSLQMIRDRPFLGFGPGTFQYAWRAYRLPRPESMGDAVHAHNEYAQFGAEMGVLAPFLLLWLLFAHVRSGLRDLARAAPFSRNVTREGEAPAEPSASGNLGRAYRVDWILAALVASPVGLAVANVADFHWHIPATALLFWAILGLTRTWLASG